MISQPDGGSTALMRTAGIAGLKRRIIAKTLSNLNFVPALILAARWEPLFADCQRAERFGGEPTLGLGCDNHRESCGLITKPDSLPGLGPALRDAGVSLK